MLVLMGSGQITLVPVTIEGVIGNKVPVVVTICEEREVSKEPSNKS